MKDSGVGTNGASRLAKSNLPATISERKRNANKQNAKKSTGPKTPSGKAYSRRNALKHGLLARQSMDFDVLREDPKAYDALLNGLREAYQPIGTAEELEIERVAVCWGKFRRAWRYENVVNRVAVRDFGMSELAEQVEYCKARDKEAEAFVLQLQSIKREIEATSEMSQELLQRM